MQPSLQKRFAGKDKAQIDQIIKEEIIRVFPERVEITDGTYERCQQVKKYVRGVLQEHQKVLLVTHSNFIRTWTGDWTEMTRPFTKLPKKNVSVAN
jgi:broad specificity phosphatase PhoE